MTGGLFFWVFSSLSFPPRNKYSNSLTNYAKTNEQRGRTSIAERATRTDEQTGTNDARERHHRQMAVLEAALHSRIRIMEIGVSDGAVSTIDGLMIATRGGFLVGEAIATVYALSVGDGIVVVLNLLVATQHVCCGGAGALRCVALRCVVVPCSARQDSCDGSSHDLNLGRES